MHRYGVGNLAGSILFFTTLGPTLASAEAPAAFLLAQDHDRKVSESLVFTPPAGSGAYLFIFPADAFEASASVPQDSQALEHLKVWTEPRLLLRRDPDPCRPTVPSEVPAVPEASRPSEGPKKFLEKIGRASEILPWAMGLGFDAEKTQQFLQGGVFSGREARFRVFYVIGQGARLALRRPGAFPPAAVLGKDNPTEFAFYYVLAPRPALRVEGLPALSWPFGFEVPGNAFRDSDEVKEGIRRRLWLQNNRAPLREFVANIDDCPVCPAAGLNELDWNGFGISSKAPRFLTRFLRKAETPGAYSSWVWVAETKEASPLIPTFHAIEFFKGRMKCAYGKTYSATLKRRKQQMKLNLQRSTALTEAEINVLVDPDGGADSGPEGR